MIACREPEEDLEETQDEPVPIATEQDVLQEEFWDDRTGKLLDSEKVRAAPAEELRELDRRVWVKADVEECWNKKGRGPKGVRWVDVEIGFGVYRSRLVAKDFKPKSKVNDLEGLVAATPPLELVKMLILKAARGSRNRHADVRKVMFLDVSKAHSYAPMLDEEFVQLPPDHPEREVRIVVHGDDFVVEGRQSDLEWVRDVLAAKYILKVRGILGPEQGDQKSIVVLVRVVDWRADELWWKLIRGVSRESCRCVEWFQEIRRSSQESSCRRRTGMSWRGSI